MISDDLSGLFLPPNGNGNTDLGYHLGLVQAWNDDTAANTVLVNGAQFKDLRVITAGPAISIAVGDTVVLFRLGTQYYILGKIAAAGASAAMRGESDFVTAFESTSSASFVDLTTPGPTVKTYVGPSGKVAILLGAQFIVPANTQAYMSVALSGANTQAAAGFRAAARGVPATAPSDTGPNSHSSPVQVVNLTPGLTTFTAKYSSSGGATLFGNRSLIVIPF